MHVPQKQTPVHSVAYNSNLWESRRPRFVAIPPFLLFIVLIIFGKAGLGEAVAIIPTAVNIGTVIVLEWEREHNKVNLTPEPYTYTYR